MRRAARALRWLGRYHEVEVPGWLLVLALIWLTSGLGGVVADAVWVGRWLF